MALRATGRAIVARTIRRTLLVVLRVTGDDEVDGVFDRVRDARDLQAEDEAQNPHRQGQTQPNSAG
jgi:hypothetical protein